MSKKKINKCLLVSFILGAMYCVYLVTYFGGALSGGESTPEQIGVGLAAALVMPHLIVTMIAVIFNGLGVFIKKPAFALVGAILYSVALVLFIPYFMFVIIQLVLSYVAYGQMRKVERGIKNATV